MLLCPDLNKGRTVMNMDKTPSHTADKAPPGFAPHNANLLGSRSITGNHGNMPYPDSEMPVFPQRAITGKQFSDGDNLHSSGIALHSSNPNLRSSGGGLHGLGLHHTSPLGGLHHSGGLHSSTSSLHGSGHLSRNHFLDGSGLSPRQITGGFSNSGAFSEGFGQGLTGRQITRGLSASFQDSSSLSLLTGPTSTASSPFVDSTCPTQRNSRSDLANLSARW